MSHVLGRLILLLLLGMCGCRPAGPEYQPPENDHFQQQLAQFRPQALTTEELRQGWISLMDGQSLYGWINESDANFQVRQGLVIVESGTAPGLLRTTTQFQDYELCFDFLSDQKTNSGVFLRTVGRPQDPAGDCYEVNIADEGTNPFPTGSLVARQQAQENFDSTGWQSLRATIRGARLRIEVDGKLASEYEDPQPITSGYIGLQFNSGRVAFGNIRLRPLGTHSIFNGRDLDGWNEYPEMKSRFTVAADGILRVQDGPGQLETTAAYGDFVLQLECMAHARGLNSGIFFRCIPGEKMNGYESQIHNGILEGDRSKPADSGTGAIFRRQPARKVVSDDLTWFYKTIIAQDAHMAVWVNGIQVTDWTDTRPADPNPRRGKRVDAGTIIIQGHDPTTDFSFRNLRIARLGEDLK